MEVNKLLILTTIWMNLKYVLPSKINHLCDILRMAKLLGRKGDKQFPGIGQGEELTKRRQQKEFGGDRTVLFDIVMVDT